MIRQAEKNEAMRVAELALLLWPNNDLATFTKEFKAWIEMTRH